MFLIIDKDFNRIHNLELKSLFARTKSLIKLTLKQQLIKGFLLRQKPNNRILTYINESQLKLAKYNNLLNPFTRVLPID